MSLKKHLRLEYKKKRLELTDDQYEKNNLHIRQLFFGHFKIDSKTRIHIYISNSSEKEVDTLDIIKGIRERESVITTSKIKQDQLINCFLDINTVLIKNKFGILEPRVCKRWDPKNLDIAIIPALICDLNGYRVGYGKGLYDKFLKYCNAKTIKIALCFFNPIEQIDDVNEYDIPMDYCITPNKIINSTIV